MKNKEYIFVINPKSGRSKNKSFEQKINELSEINNCKVYIYYTEYAGHATELAKKAVHDKKYAVVVVGGDGTVNEAARALIHTDTLLGIVPAGSGNGMARHLKIDLIPDKAISQIFGNNSKKIDVGNINGHLFLSTAGLGFDAKVAHQFAKQKNRGFRAYINTTRKELFNYVPGLFDVETEIEKISKKAFMISIANIPQFGNNFIINPLANECDGFLNCTIIAPFPKIKIPVMLNKFFKGKINESKYFTNIVGTKFVLQSNENIAHVDGEPIFINEKEINVEIIKSALQIIIP